MPPYEAWLLAAAKIAALLKQHRQGYAPSDLAHFLYNLAEGRSMDWIEWDIAGRQGAEPDSVPVAPAPEPIPETPTERFPVPDGPVDLTSWPRRGAYIAGSLVDTVWDFEALCATVGSIFGHRATMTVNVLSAPWPESVNDMVLPFVKRDDGKWDLERDDPRFWTRLYAYVETANRHGVVPLLCFLELYSWSFRKRVPFDQNLTWARNNIQGMKWGGPTREADDAALLAQPGPWLLGLVTKVVTRLRGLTFGILPGNEYPEKRVHWDIAAKVKAIDSSVRVVVNRNEDTPGQYMNMQVGQGAVDSIAFHGWKNLGFLSEDFSDEPVKRPRNFKQFFDNRGQDGRALGVDFSRVICDSDGARVSDDPVNTYNVPELAKVWKFCADKGCTILHQSRSKMGPNRGRLDTLEVDDLERMAAL